ncbi:hypothetical protein J6590_045271 [Homalodisca vitripennis]|nr:hypothetical protein J6590_045271 [Homalodisca vitripennis]
MESRVFCFDAERKATCLRLWQGDESGLADYEVKYPRTVRGEEAVSIETVKSLNPTLPDVLNYCRPSACQAQTHPLKTTKRDVTFRDAIRKYFSRAEHSSLV